MRLETLDRTCQMTETGEFPVKERLVWITDRKTGVKYQERARRAQDASGLGHALSVPSQAQARKKGGCGIVHRFRSARCAGDHRD